MQAQNVSNLSLVQPASFNPKPYRPSKVINLAAGLVIGMLLGCSIATLRDIRQRTLASNVAEAPTLELPLLAEIPHQSERRFIEVWEELARVKVKAQ